MLFHIVSKDVGKINQSKHHLVLAAVTLVLILLVGGCQIKKSNPSNNRKVLPSYLFDKFEYENAHLISEKFTPKSYTIFKHYGQIENKLYKVISKKKQNLNLEDYLLVDLPTFRENIFDKLSQTDTLLIMERITNDSIISYSCTLSMLETKENNSILFTTFDKDVKLDTNLYYDFNWKAGDWVARLSKGGNAISGNSLLKIDTLKCLSVYVVSNTYYSGDKIEYYIPQIGSIKWEYGFITENLIKINNIPLSEYIDEKCKNYTPILDKIVN